MEEFKELIKVIDKDEDGLYKNAPNYKQCREKIDKLRGVIKSNS